VPVRTAPVPVRCTAPAGLSNHEVAFKLFFFARCFERELTPIPPLWISARVDVGLGANDRAMNDAFVIPAEA
jgi:hypothetical protein